MKIITCVLLLFQAFSQARAQSKFQTDFTYYWQTIHDNFAYFDKQKTNWGQVKTIYQPIVDTVKTQSEFIHLLEKINNELYNGHVFLNTNTNSSNRTIPTGADLKIIFKEGKFKIDEVRENFNADLCGLKKNMVILSFNDLPFEQLVKSNLPKSINSEPKAAYEYTATYLLAGKHNEKRKITVFTEGKEKSFYPDSISNKTEENYSTTLDYKTLKQNIGYIKINNSLGNASLINEFDATLDKLMHTNGLILDLRETPSGGNTTVARAILGRLVDKELPYQKHIYTAAEKETGIKRSTLELVSPRKTTYKKPVIVLVNYWTGSMAEGIAIGLDGIKRAKIVGSKMAGLLGEIYTYETPEMKIPFSFPAVKLQSITGQPREDFQPIKPIGNIMLYAIKMKQNTKKK